MANQQQGSPQQPLYDRLRAAGWRMTAQRRVVAKVLEGEHLHLTADQIYERAQKSLPEISLATVYNTLHDLVAMGQVQEVITDGNSKRYDPNVERPHHHLVCTDCGELRDVFFDREAPTLHREECGGYEVTSVQILFHGRCPKCAETP